MRSSVAICVTFLLPATLILAVPLSKSDASLIIRQIKEQEEHNDFVRRMLYVDGVASDLEPKEKRDPSPTTAALDTASSNNSSALDSPFAVTHHMGHGPAVRPLTTSSSATPSSTEAVSVGSTPEAFPNVVNTHGDNKDHTYQPVTPSGNMTNHAHKNTTNQTYQCDPALPAENLTTILMTGRPQDDPGCRVAGNKTAHANATFSVPEQNKNNPAYIGGGEAAAPPGYHDTPDRMKTSIPAGEDSIPIEVKVSQDANGTETTTTTVTETIKGGQANGTNMGDFAMGTDIPDSLPATNMSDVSSSTEAAASTSTGKPRTPYALPPGFTGP